MNYYAYIKGTTHNLVQGITISEQYNETLDSASIVISDSPQLEIYPYDDVFLYGEYCGIYEEGKIVPNYNKKFEFKGYPVNNDLYNSDEMPCFYKHFLVYKFTEQIIILGDKEENTRYKYTIELFSETKGLETIQADTTAITQPLSNNKISAVTYINRYLELYNKKIKVSSTNDFKDWEEKIKYSIGDINKFKYVDIDNNEHLAPPILLSNLSEIFQNNYTQDFSLTNPTLRQLLEKIFIVKDCIPIIYDDQLYAMNISITRGNFDLKKGEINYITGSLSSENYCTNLKRVYSDALPAENSTRYVESLGFRNRDNSLLTYSNLRLETTYPIYKINKIYMCYYKPLYIKGTDGIKNFDYTILCKQDITPFIKLNSERNLLSQDTATFANNVDPTIEEFTSYKFGTIGYDIGSNYISGWGEQYSYLTGNFWWQEETRSILQNIFEYMDRKYPVGVFDENLIREKMGITEDNALCYRDYNDFKITNVSYDSMTRIRNNIIIPDVDYDKESGSVLLKKLSTTLDTFNGTLHLKHLVFEIDYQGFFSGNIIQSKGIISNDITIVDNQSSSLALLESEGSNQESKIKRFGNKGIQISARYKNVNDIQDLGSIYNYNKDQNIIIYSKQYSINDNVINCSYYGTKNYVLKDYFTSVYAKYRTYNLMSYSESIQRNMNEKIYLYISKENKYKDRDLNLSFEKFDSNISKEKILFSFYNKSVFDSNNETIIKNKINYGFFYNENIGIIASDLNMFTTGNVLCLNIAMTDNITAGVNIAYMKNSMLQLYYLTTDYVNGGLQQWITSTEEDGTIKELNFGFAHYSGNIKNIIKKDKLYDIYYKGLFKLPYIEKNISDDFSNVISFKKNVYKDNKERLNMTFQIEPITDNDIYLSPWFFKLNDLVFSNEKILNDVHETTIEYKNPYWESNIYHTCIPVKVGSIWINYCALILVDKEDHEEGEPIEEEKNFKFEIDLEQSAYNEESLSSYDTLFFKSLKLKGVKYKRKSTGIGGLTNKSIEITCKTNIKTSFFNYTPLGNYYYPINTILVFDQISHTNDSYGWKYNDIDLSNYYNTIKAREEFKNRDIYICLLKNSWGDNTKNFEFTLGNIEHAKAPNSNYKDFFSAVPDFCYNLNCLNYSSIIKDPNTFGMYKAKVEIELEAKIKEKNIYWILLNSQLDDSFTKNEYTKIDDFGEEINVEIEFNKNNDAVITHNQQDNKYVACYYKHEGIFSFVFGFKTSLNKDIIKLSVLSSNNLTIYDKKTNLEKGKLNFTEYTLNIVYDDGFKNVIVQRGDEKLVNGSGIYLGDKLKISDYNLKENYYYLEGDNGEIQVEGNVNINLKSKYFPKKDFDIRLVKFDQERSTIQFAFDNPYDIKIYYKLEIQPDQYEEEWYEIDNSFLNANQIMDIGITYLISKLGNHNVSDFSRGIIRLTISFNETLNPKYVFESQYQS